ncbi:aspartic peptidase domain-containing protein [Pilobolus umbonatus]|nr:aspartic peptidase domain-containing protein [Pilobolus umbonatus]
MQLNLVVSGLLVAAIHLVQADGVIRAPILMNPNREHPLKIARRRHEILSRRDQQYRAPLYNDQGSQYLVEVSIGTPGQKFAVTLDTGSADLWVPSNQCPTSACPFSRFNPEASSTFNNLDKPFGIQYGIGSVNGTYVTDTVSIGGATIQNQQFGLALTTADILNPHTSSGGSSGPNSSVEANGILGLGFPALTQSNSKGGSGYNPFVFNLVQQNLLDKPVFSIFLNSIQNQGYAGEIVFGGIDDSKYTGDLVYLPVAGLTSRANESLNARTDDMNAANDSDFYYWMVYAQGLGVSNNSGNNPAWRLRQIGAFILDTGTTLTYLPNSVATDVVSAIAGEGGYILDRQSGVFVVNCSTAYSGAKFELHMSPDAEFTSNPVILSVPANELVIPIDGNSVDTASTCMFGIAPSGDSGGIGSNMYLIGDSVLRSTYMVFDIGEKRVGLATSINVGGSVSVGNSTSTSGSGTSNSSGSILQHIDYYVYILLSILAIGYTL